MKPILFNTEMVRAILDGRKSVTRRVVKPQPQNNDCEHEMITFNDMLPQFYSGDYTCVCRKCGYGVQPISGKSVFRPPYRPGDILYVRETWALQFGLYWHKAGLTVDENGCDMHGTLAPTKWRPSIHMPKEAARLFLRVTDVRVERLQDITEEQAIAEGAKKQPCEEWVEKRTERAYFASLWDSTIKKADLPRYGWDANPWCWVISFERITKDEAMQ